MQTRLFASTPWRYVGVAIVPGLAAIILRSDPLRQAMNSSGQDLVSLSISMMCATFVILGLLWKRQLAPWMFPALGVLLQTLPGVVLGVILPPSSSNSALFSSLVNFWVITAWGVTLVIAFKYRHAVQIPKLGWLLLGLTLVISPLASLTMGGLLLLPVAIGLLLVRRNGLLAGLVPVAGIYWLADGIFDPSYSLPTSASLIVEAGLAAFFLVVTPLWVLRARSTRAQFWGLIWPAVLALIGCEVSRGATFRGTAQEYSLQMWLTRGQGAAQILFALAATAVIYGTFTNQTPSAQSAEPSDVSMPMRAVE